MVLSDEIYSRLQFEGEPFSILSVPGMQERTILLDGFSKTYAMTGWRIGYGVMRADLAAQITRLMTNSNSCTASFHADGRARGAARRPEPRRCHARRIRAAQPGLCRWAEPHSRDSAAACPRGAFYVFANITGTGWQSKPLADALLDQAGVAALSGTSFGQYGEGYLRFSVANSMENLIEALDRMEALGRDKICSKRKRFRKGERQWLCRDSGYGRSDRPQVFDRGAPDAGQPDARL